MKTHINSKLKAPASFLFLLKSHDFSRQNSSPLVSVQNFASNWPLCLVITGPETLSDQFHTFTSFIIEGLVYFGHAYYKNTSTLLFNFWSTLFPVKSKWSETQVSFFCKRWIEANYITEKYWQMFVRFHLSFSTIKTLD